MAARHAPEPATVYDPGMSTEWVLLSYWLPREPSTPRIALWRKVKRIGAAKISDGLVALPHDPRTREQFDWLAAEVEEAGGSAAVWIARPGSERTTRDLRAQLVEARAQEYAQIIADAREHDPTDTERRARHKRLLAELHRIGRRDYFAAPNRDDAHAAVAAMLDMRPVKARRGA
jgi:hypothetical protein